MSKFALPNGPGLSVKSADVGRSATRFGDFKNQSTSEILLQMAYRFVSLVLFLLSWLQPAVAGGPDGSKGDHAEQTDAIFAALHSNNAPGAAVLVLKDGSTLLQRGYA